MVSCDQSGLKIISYNHTDLCETRNYNCSFKFNQSKVEINSNVINFYHIDNCLTSYEDIILKEDEDNIKIILIDKSKFGSQCGYVPVLTQIKFNKEIN